MDLLLVDYTYFAWTLPMSWSDKGGVPGIDKKNLQSQCISMGFYLHLTHKQYYLILISQVVDKCTYLSFISIIIKI